MGYKYKDFFADLVTPFMISLVMYLCMAVLLLLGMNDLITGILQIVTGLFVYLVCLKVFKVSEIEDIKLLIKSKISHNA